MPSNEEWLKRLLALQADAKQTDSDAETSHTVVELDQTKVGRLSRMDAMQYQAMQHAVAARRRNKLSRIEAALQRLEKDEFGYCLRCGTEIALKRLETDPTTVVCGDCAT